MVNEWFWGQIKLLGLKIEKGKLIWGVNELARKKRWQFFPKIARSQKLQHFKMRLRISMWVCPSVCRSVCHWSVSNAFVKWVENKHFFTFRCLVPYAMEILGERPESIGCVSGIVFLFCTSFSFLYKLLRIKEGLVGVKWIV